MTHKKGVIKKRRHKKHPFVRIKRKLRLIYLKIVRIDDPPERIARGAAIGVLMGILPTFGLGVVLSLAAAFVFRANKAAAILGSLIMNPLTSPFFWSLSIVIGSVVLREDSSAIFEKLKNGSFLSNIEWASMVYMTGNVIISAVLTAAAYFLVKDAIISHRRHKARKRLEKKGG